jgi:valacyclovir hydrolase
MSSFEHGGSQIYYEEEGSGEPVLLLPGWGGTIEEFSSLRAALAPKFKVIAADVPGSGKSGPQPREYTATYFQDDARALLALLDHLGAAPAHVVGFSDGGEYALVMASLKPSAARSVVTWGAAGTVVEPMPGMFEAMHNIIDSPIEPLKEFSGYLKAAYGEANARSMAQSVSKAWSAIAQAGGDISRSRAAEITCPALLITGEQDFMAPPPLVSEMASAIRGGEFVEAKGAGHDVHSAQPEWLATTVVDWLAKH